MKSNRVTTAGKNQSPRIGSDIDLWKHSTAIALTILTLTLAVFIGYAHWFYNHDSDPAIVTLNNFLETAEPQRKEINQYAQEREK